MAGGRPQRDEAERLSAVLAVRVTATERAVLEARAEAAETPLGVFLRAALTGAAEPRRRRRSAAAEPRFSREAVTALNRLGVNLNQLTRAHHYGSDDPLRDELAALLAMIRAELERGL